MKKILSLILVMMTIAFNAIAGEQKTSSSSSKPVSLEVHQTKEQATMVHRAPMRINIEAWYDAETNSIDISFDGEAEGEVFLYVNGYIADYASEINTTLSVPDMSGQYEIQIIGETWIAQGFFTIH